jgi:RND family efflux transporter MFP subunit
MKSYRAAFAAALTVNVLLLAIVGGFWWRSRAVPATPHAGSVPSHAPTSSAPTSAAATPEQAEPLLAPMQISPQRLQSIGVQTGEVERKSVNDRVLTTGNVAMDETRLAYVQMRFSGYIQRVFVDATYQYVRKGQPLFSVYSPDLVSTEREYLIARSSQRQLAQVPDSEITADTASLVNAATERLKQWNIPTREIARLESTGQVLQDLEIDSPVSGFITEREALPNKYVQPDTRLYAVADLSTVWVLAQIFQNDLGRIKVGDSATLTVDTYPGRTFTGRVDFIYPDIDLTTRTGRARLVFPNPELLLKPGMFVNVAFDIPMGEQDVIPAAGVLHSGARQIVFVDHGGGNLEPREVELGARAGADFIVLKGVKAGDRIITSANFLIDSESQLQAALGTFTAPPAGEGGAAALNAPATNVELSTDPTPPHKGSNLVRVKLTDEKGLPLTGSQVNATFFMPAMPAMGMAAMRVSVTLSDRGNGVYEGKGDLKSGGTWQVMVLGKKGDQVVASKQVSVNVAGGM